MTTIDVVNKPKTTLALPTLPKPLRQTKKSLDSWSKWLDLMRAAGDVAGVIHPLTKTISICLGTTKFPTVLSIPFTAKEVVDEALKVVTKPKIAEKVTALSNVAVKTASIALSMVGLFAFLEKINVVGKAATQWFHAVYVANFITGFISLGLAADTARKSIGLRTVLRQGENALQTAKDDDVAKANAIVNTLCEIQSREVTPTRKKLLLSKTVGLEETAHSLTHRLVTTEGDARKEAIREGEKLIHMLAGRAKTDLILSVANVVNKIISIIGSGLLFFPPAFSIGIVFLAVNTTISFVLWSTKTYFINRNPLDPNSCSKAASLYYRLFPQKKVP